MAGEREPFSWAAQYQARRAAARRFGPLMRLPMVRRASQRVMATARDGQRVLEIGAGDRRFAQRLRERFPGLEYVSLDPDPAGGHDHQSFDSVVGPFDLVFALEVAEHLPAEELPHWLGQIATRLAPGGQLILSTPNTYYPPAYLRDMTHRTPLCYDELAGLVTQSGLEVTGIWRVHHDPWTTAWVRRYLFGWLFRLLGIDFARQVVVAAVRPAGAGDKKFGETGAAV